MNKDLIIQKKKYESEERTLYFTISRIEDLLKKESFYQEPESLIALTKIKSYLQEKKERLKEIEQEQKKLAGQINAECQHEIILKSDYNTNCCICHRLFIDSPDFEHILIEYDGYLTPSFYKTIDDSIYEIIGNDQNLLDNFEDKITSKIKQIRMYRRK